MDILSINHLLFILVVLFVYNYLTPKLRGFWILIASFTFYGSISFLLLGTLSFSILFNYWITFSNFQWKIWIASIVNIIILLSFKINESSFLLSVGVSFFTFQGLSFVIDYSKKSKVQLLCFANYMAFFPQLIAGPIETFDDLGSQLKDLRNIKKENFLLGLSLILKGLVIKFVLANRCGLIVTSFYNEISAFDGWFLLFANLLFTFQILLDFSGYCLIAIGVAKIMGISLSNNFDMPYKATSLSIFWKKWHITLHRWFKKYLFNPLTKKHPFWIAAGIVFLTSSLWHGAQLRFVVWGTLCFTFLLLDKFVLQNINLPKVFKIILVFSLTYICWIPFRINKIYDFKHLLNLKFNLKSLMLFFADHAYVLRKDFLNNISSICMYNDTSLNITYLDFYILILSLFIFLIFSNKFKSLKSSHSSIILFLVLCFFSFDNSTPFIYFNF